jgi:xylulokinase
MSTLTIPKQCGASQIRILLRIDFGARRTSIRMRFKESFYQLVNIMPPAIALGLDLGTSGVRVVAIDSQGYLVAQTHQSYPLYTPQPGWTEQRPHEWVKASITALKAIALNLQNVEIAALGLSGQMHGMVTLDSSGTVVYPAILWNDQRTGAAVAEIESKIPRNELIQRTGNRAVTGFQLPKLLWLRNQEPEAFARTTSVLLPKDYLGFIFTGKASTEPADASGVGCLNLGDRQWDHDILSALNLSSSLFPPVIQSTDRVGYLTREMAEQTTLPIGLPIIAGGGDNAAAAIGLGILSTRPTRGSLSLGTSGVILAPVPQPTPDPEGRVHLFCHVDGGYHLLGVTLSAAGSIRWCQDTIAPEMTVEQLSDLAATAPVGSDGLIFLPHLSGERSPYLDPTARGGWIGLSLAHQRSHLIRAVLEGVTFSLKAAFEVMQPLVTLDELVITGGGAKSPVWRQIVADVLQTQLGCPDVEEGAAYGAALIAWVGIGLYRNFEALVQVLPQSQTIIMPTVQPIYDLMFKQYQSQYYALKTVRAP